MNAIVMKMLGNAIKVEAATKKKYSQYNDICKNNIIQQYDAHFTKSATACARQLGRERSYMASQRYAHYGELQECTQWSWPRCFMRESPWMKLYRPLSQPQSKTASQATRSSLLGQVYIGWSHDQNWKLKPCFDVINRRASQFYWSRKALVAPNSIITTRLNRLCKHPDSQLFQLLSHGLLYT
jgi:hypothetical protein